MRTTVTLDEDVAAAVDQLRAERHIGVSAALNELARAGLRARPTAGPFRQGTREIGLRLDVSNIGEVLELLDDESRGAQ